MRLVGRYGGDKVAVWLDVEAGRVVVEGEWARPPGRLIVPFEQPAMSWLANALVLARDLAAVWVAGADELEPAALRAYLAAKGWRGDAVGLFWHREAEPPRTDAGEVRCPQWKGALDAHRAVRAIARYEGRLPTVVAAEIAAADAAGSGAPG